MTSQNLGQVSGLWIGTSAPTNTTLIWYDSTPAIRCHKVYSVAAAAWVVLDQNVISTITYSELRNLARGTGLTQGSWYKISDQGNILALAITSTKVQYVDVNSNFVIDDLAASATYVVTSSNLLIDDVSGVWDATNKRLKFSFADTDHDGNTDNDYVFGKKQRIGVWSLAKYKLSSLVSAVTGNALSWNRGIFFNFNSALNSKIDVAGGVVGKNTYDSEKAVMNQNISNVAESNQAIIDTAKNYTDIKVAPSEIYGKTLPSAPTSGTAIDIAQGDTLLTIITKIQRWVNQFKVATGMRVSSNFAPYATVADINNNDTVDSALRKVQKWINNVNIEIKLKDSWVPSSYTGIIPSVQAGDTFETAFAKLQGKFDQIGTIRDGLIQSRAVTLDGSIRTEINLSNGYISFKDTVGVTSGHVSSLTHSKLNLTSFGNDVSIEANKTVIRHDGESQISELGWGSVLIRGNSSSGFALAAINENSVSYADIFAPRLEAGWLQLRSYVLVGSGYSVSPLSGSFVISSDLNTVRDIYLPANPRSGTIVWVAITSNQNVNVTCTSESNNGIDTIGQSAQSVTIGTRGRIYCFTFQSHVYYTVESRRGLWTYGYMSH